MAGTNAQSEGPQADIAEAGTLDALAALGRDVDPEQPALPQLVAAQDRLTQLVADYHAWPAAEPGGATAEAAPSFAALKPKYEALFAGAKVLDKWKNTVAWYAAKLHKGRARYEAIEQASGVPWWFVGVVHAMEASFSFTGHLHNGDPLSAKTVQVPKNRPKVWNPPNDWQSSALDALDRQGLLQAGDWTLARVLYRLEAYNGYGYHAIGINSPYLWSFSNQWTKGKYVADHKYDPNATSKQCGAAVMLRALTDAGDIMIKV